MACLETKGHQASGHFAHDLEALVGPHQTLEQLREPHVLRASMESRMQLVALLMLFKYSTIFSFVSYISNVILQSFDAVCSKCEP